MAAIYSGFGVHPDFQMVLLSKITFLRYLPPAPPPPTWHYLVLVGDLFASLTQYTWRVASVLQVNFDPSNQFS